MFDVSSNVDCANQASIEAEKAILDLEVHAGAMKIAPSYSSPKEAGTIRLIRTHNGQVCTLFSHYTYVAKSRLPTHGHIPWQPLQSSVP